MRHALACVVEGKIQIAPFAIKVTRVYIELNSMTVLSFDLLTLNFTIRLGTFLYAVCRPIIAMYRFPWPHSSRLFSFGLDLKSNRWRGSQLPETLGTQGCKTYRFYTLVCRESDSGALFSKFGLPLHLLQRGKGPVT